MSEPETSLTLSGQRLIAMTGVISRRKLRKSKLYIYFEDGSKVPYSEDVEITEKPQVIKVMGRLFRVRLGPPAVLAMHKPPDVVSSHVSDAPGIDTVYDYLPLEYWDAGVESVGRLDQDTEGLLLFTSDGQLLHRLIHPKRAVPRTYLARVNGTPTEEALERLRRGDVELNDGHRPHPTEVVVVEDGGKHDAPWIRVTLTEGKYHEVRRMFAAIETPVIVLRRTSYGPITLDEVGPMGECVALPDQRVLDLYETVGMTPDPEHIEVLPLLEPPEA